MKQLAITILVCLLLVVVASHLGTRETTGEPNEKTMLLDCDGGGGETVLCVSNRPFLRFGAGETWAICVMLTDAEWQILVDAFPSNVVSDVVLTWEREEK